MYRIFCESYENFKKTFNEKSSRLTNAEPFELIVNINQYNIEKSKQSELYKKVSDLIYYMEKNIDVYPKLKAFLWTLSSRNIEAKQYNVSNLEELEEQTKLVNSFLKLAYWY